MIIGMARKKVKHACPGHAPAEADYSIEKDTADRRICWTFYRLDTESFRQVVQTASIKLHKHSATKNRGEKYTQNTNQRALARFTKIPQFTEVQGRL
jgi:hypothetical protein